MVGVSSWVTGVRGRELRKLSS